MLEVGVEQVGHDQSMQLSKFDEERTVGSHLDQHGGPDLVNAVRLPALEDEGPQKFYNKHHPENSYEDPGSFGSLEKLLD